MATVEHASSLRLLNGRISKVFRVALTLDGVFNAVFLCKHIDSLVSTAWGYFYILIAVFPQKIGTPILEVMAFHTIYYANTLLVHLPFLFCINNALNLIFA